MSRAPSATPLRRFLRGLFITGLSLLLPFQLALLWFASLDAPVKLPASVTSFLTERLAAQGLRLQARDFWLLPDQSLAADDLTLEVIGVTGEIFTTERIEIGVSLPNLLGGRVSAKRVRVRGGKLWCPAAVSQFGQNRLLAEDIRLEGRREGRWLMVPSLLARSGKFVAAFQGELPSALLLPSPAPAGTRSTTPLAASVAPALRLIEDILLVAERSGGASLTLEAKGTASGGAQVTGHAVIGNDWSQAGIGLIQTRELVARGTAELDALGQLQKWRTQIAAKHLAFRTLRAGELALLLEGTHRLAETQGHLTLEQVDIDTFGGLQIQATLTRPRNSTGQAGLGAQFRATTALSRVEGLARWIPAARATEPDDFSLQIPTGNLAASDLLRAAPFLEAPFAQADIGLTSGLNIADLEIRRVGVQWHASGEVSCSGLEAMGLSATTIAPRRNLPLLTRFSYQPERTPYALQLRDLRLASVTGEADCSLDPGGPFVLRLQGELQPACLDRLLGPWWAELWKLFTLNDHPPYATIDVASHWGEQTSEVRGRVHLADFTFLGAPFRSVDVVVQAEAKSTIIGLQRLQGGAVAADGSLHGTVTWDWSKPVAERGPYIRLHGDLQPWIAGRCASAELGETLRNLRLSAEHSLDLELSPRAGALAMVAHVKNPGPFTAWGIASQGLILDVTSHAEHLSIKAGLALADGQAELTILGNPFKDATVRLQLQGCDPVKVAKVMEQWEPAPAGTTPPSTPTGATSSRGKLDLKFLGSINLKAPRLLKGRGEFALFDPELKRVRVLGGISSLLETIGVKSTSYDLTEAQGTFGCLAGRAYFPDLVIKGPDARLALTGEVDLLAASLDFAGDFALPKKEGFNPLDIFNLNRALISLSRIRVNGPLAKPEVSTLPKLSDILKLNKDSELGKIPPSVLE